MTERPFLTEVTQDGTLTSWYCEPPRPGLAFRAVRDEWREGTGAWRGKWFRDIYEVEVLGHEVRAPYQSRL